MDQLSALLNDAELRVLGSLVEKAATTPDTYPLSLNALTLACNQLTNRDPVVAFDETTVVRALDGLREKRLAAQFAGAESRVTRGIVICSGVLVSTVLTLVVVPVFYRLLAPFTRSPHAVARQLEDLQRQA